MKMYLYAVLAGSILASGSAYAQETEEGELPPAVFGTPQQRWEGELCGPRVGTIVERVYETGDGSSVLEFSRNGEAYGYTVRTRGSDGLLLQYSLADFDGDGLYERVDAEDVVCPQE